MQAGAAHFMKNPAERIIDHLNVMRLHGTLIAAAPLGSTNVGMIALSVYCPTPGQSWT
jgi:hypothetical protein